MKIQHGGYAIELRRGRGPAEKREIRPISKVSDSDMRDAIVQQAVAERRQQQEIGRKFQTLEQLTRDIRRDIVGEEVKRERR